MSKTWSKQCSVCGKKAGKTAQYCADCGTEFKALAEAVESKTLGTEDALDEAVGKASADSEGTFEAACEAAVEPSESCDDGAEAAETAPADVDTVDESPASAEAVKTAPPSPESKSFCLVATNGPEKGESFEIHPNCPYFVGRGEDADICLDYDSRVSRRHALLEVRDGHLIVSDSGSTNGTFKSVDLDVCEEGEKIMFGETVFQVVRMG